MNELTRFIQSRTTQRLSDEKKSTIGLPLYSDGHSKLVKELIKAGCNREALIAAIKKYLEKKGELTQLAQDINPLVLELYKWFDYKARPVKFIDYEDFVSGCLSSQFSDFKKKLDWDKHSDIYLIALLTGEIGQVSEMNYDLMVRCLHILKLTTKEKQGELKATGNDLLLNKLLSLPILLPQGLLKGRCCNKGKVKTVGLERRFMMATDYNPENPDLPNQQKDPCDCECNEDCQPPSSYCICLKPYVADLLIVKEELIRYEEGDIAYIENILAGETKNRIHRNLLRSEDYVENETEVSSSEEKDLQVSEKFALQNEVQKTVASDVGIDAGVTYSNKFGKHMEISANANVSTNFSKLKAESVARSYARDVVDRSASKLSEKVRTLESNKVLNELEETTEHGIDNIKGDHRSGIYYWVNKVSKAQIFNYGKRMMIDVYVPEPAALYKKLYRLNKEEQLQRTISRPKKPTIKLKEIKRKNYADLLSEYGVSSAEAPPKKKMAIQMSFQHHVTEPEKGITTGFSTSFKSEPIPDDYEAVSMDYQVSCAAGNHKNTKTELGTEKDEVSVLIHVGGEAIFRANFDQRDDSGVNKEWYPDSDTISLDKVSGMVEIGASGYSTMGLALTGDAIIQCNLKKSSFQAWQLKVYNLIMEEYHQKLSDYEIQQEEALEILEIKGKGAFINRETERNELKRHIIAILMCNYFNGIGSMMSKVANCGYPEINFEKLEKDTPLIRFFEQVFEWNYVSYLFYHSMWARKCRWPDLIDADSGDSLFDKFLMSGASRVQVPIREGMEEVFNYYLNTGKIWGESGEPPIFGDDDYVSMIQEIIEGRQGDYSQRDGSIEATSGSEEVLLTNTTYYWDVINDQLNQLNLDNDIDREILIDLEVYRISSIEQLDPADETSWKIVLDRPFEGITALDLKHAVGSKFVGAPWEVIVPTKLVYLQNETDKLPNYKG